MVELIGTVLDSKITSLLIHIMENLKKAGRLSTWSYTDISALNKKSSDISLLLKDIGIITNKKFLQHSKLLSVEHTDELKVTINNTISIVKVEENEEPGDNILSTNEPQELKFFTYESLKKSAIYNKKDNIYRGKLYGTVQTFDCSSTQKCSSCDGSGICACCNGNKQVTCTVCMGSLECPQCEGTGKYKCTKCGGSGSCAECGGDGWVTCCECDGDGDIVCPDCGGSGNYIDTTCNKCGGSGEYINGSQCRACGGSGRYVIKCKCCGGDGRIKCPECEGEGRVDCNNCNGSGECPRCHGKGGWACLACHSTGTCGKCKGKGIIWCPDCHGKGKCFNCKGNRVVPCSRCNGTGYFQKFKEFSFEENNKTKYHFTLPLDDSEINEINGSLLYEGTIYEFFAQKAITYNLLEATKILNGFKMDKFIEWIKIENLSNFTEKSINDDYLNTTIKCKKVPVTKLQLKSLTDTFNIYIISEANYVYYDKLPGLFSIFLGNLFG